jgi:hypothetical protein
MSSSAILQIPHCPNLNGGETTQHLLQMIQIRIPKGLARILATSTKEEEYELAKDQKVEYGSKYNDLMLMI